MEFERAVFRVYERSMDSLLIEEDPSRTDQPFYGKSCLLFEYITLGLGTIMLAVLFILHNAFVGSPGCLPEALTYYNASTGLSYPIKLQRDQILTIRIADTAIAPKHLRARTDDYEGRRLFSWPINEKSNTVHHLNKPITPLTNSTQNSTNPIPITDDPYYEQQSYLLENYDYIVTFDVGVTLLNNDYRINHHFEVINVTLGGFQCFGGSKMTETLLPIGGVDRAILNNVMYTTHLSGYMMTASGDYYHWTDEDITPNRTPDEWMNKKLSILSLTLLAFFLLSTITALLVRVLISSGVIVILPIFWACQSMGINGLNLRIISYSYPWIGLPLQLIQSRNQSLIPFVIGHFTKVFIYYTLFIAAENVFLKWLLYENNFLQGQIWLYAIMMIWEYYSMIYLRSALSIEYFPKVSLLLFAAFHFYLYSFPGGFHLLALLVMFLYLLSFMTYCLRHFEAKAYRQGIVSMERPRMLFNVLPWPTWRAELAPDYTLFMPVSSRSTNTVYQNTVPPRPGETTNADGSASTANAAGGEQTQAPANPSNPANPTNPGTSSSFSPWQFFQRIFDSSATNYHSLDTHPTPAGTMNSMHQQTGTSMNTGNIHRNGYATLEMESIHDGQGTNNNSNNDDDSVHHERS